MRHTVEPSHFLNLIYLTLSTEVVHALTHPPIPWRAQGKPGCLCPAMPRPCSSAAPLSRQIAALPWYGSADLASPHLLPPRILLQVTRLLAAPQLYLDGWEHGHARCAAVVRHEIDQTHIMCHGCRVRVQNDRSPLDYIHDRLADPGTKIHVGCINLRNLSIVCLRITRSVYSNKPTRRAPVMAAVLRAGPAGLSTVSMPLNVRESPRVGHAGPWA